MQRTGDAASMPEAHQKAHRHRTRHTDQHGPAQLAEMLRLLIRRQRQSHQEDGDKDHQGVAGPQLPQEARAQHEKGE